MSGLPLWLFDDNRRPNDLSEEMVIILQKLMQMHKYKVWTFVPKPDLFETTFPNAIKVVSWFLMKDAVSSFRTLSQTAARWALSFKERSPATLIWKRIR